MRPRPHDLARPIAGALLVGLLVLGPACRLPGTETHAANVRAGEELVLSLERHHVRTGRYPAELSGLVPSELAAVPVPTWANGAPMVHGFRYFPRPDGSAFRLIVDDVRSLVGPSDRVVVWTSGGGREEGDVSLFPYAAP